MKSLFAIAVLLLAAACARLDVSQRCCENEYEILTDNYQQPDSFTLFIPQAFTPNADGINDQFYPVGVGWRVKRMVIRRGISVVYESTSDIEAFWNGGSERDGRYRYDILFEAATGDEFEVRGDVCVMRYGARGDRLPELEREKICDCTTLDVIDSSTGPAGTTVECPVVEQ